MKKIVLHPFILAIYPVLFLFSRNVNQSFSPVLIVAAVTISIIAVLYMLLLFLLTDHKKAGLITSSFSVFFFSYGHLNIALKNILHGYTNFVLVPVSLLALAAAIFFILRSKKDLSTINLSLNTVTSILLILISFQILYDTAKMSINKEELFEKWDAAAIMGPKHKGKLPDIYYLIVDAWPRSDMLKDRYHYDDSSFRDALKERGFYIAEKSRTNYYKTDLSLASSLNGQHLQALAEQLGKDYPSRKYLYRMIRENLLFEILRYEGYKIVAFSSPYRPTDFRDADMYIKDSFFNGNEFLATFIYTTFIRFVEPLIKKEISGYSAAKHNAEFIFDNFHVPNYKKSPKLVFAHLQVPHPPFIFDENGGPGYSIVNKVPFSYWDGNLLNNVRKLTTDEYRDAFVPQLIYTDKRILQLVDNILKTSKEEPVIIIQGDHGPDSRLIYYDIKNSDMKQRMAIMNMYYLPKDGKKRLYPSISPVNMMTVLLNEYFGKNLEYLEDRGYASRSLSRPYDFIEIISE